MTTTTGNWVNARVSHTSGALATAIDEGLTSHTLVGRNGKTVELADGTSAVEFVSCSYLGLETHPTVVEAARETLSRVGIQFASSRTRMCLNDFHELEERLTAIYRGAPVTCFLSVGNVHLGVLPLLGAGELPGYPVSAGGVQFFLDRTAHASMQVLRGILEQIGPVRRFDSDRIDDLAVELAKAQAAQVTPIVLVDGIGSMGGLIDVAALHRVTAQAEGYLYVDDAHGISISGALGAGYAFEELGGTLPARVLLAGSMSKAFGGQGGFCVLSDRASTAALRRFANPLIFGGPLALPIISGNLASAGMHLSGDVAALQRRLWDNTNHFDALTGHSLVNSGTRSPVRGALFDSEDEALAATRRLRAAEVLVTPAFYPTVAHGTGLVRFAVSAAHSAADIGRAATALREVPSVVDGDLR